MGEAHLTIFCYSNYERKKMQIHCLKFFCVCQILLTYLFKGWNNFPANPDEFKQCCYYYTYRRNIFSSLFDQIFAHNWKSSDSKTNSAVSSLICQIVTLNSSFLQRAFSNLTQHFNKTEAATLTETGSLTSIFSN